jgi:hypothetical protein
MLAGRSAGQLCAIRRLMHRSKVRHEPSLSSLNDLVGAEASSEAGVVRPKAFAVLRLMRRSKLVGSCTGRSPPFALL